MGAFVYMLLCADGSFYVGSATGDDLTKRVAEHNAGLTLATRRRDARSNSLGQSTFHALPIPLLLSASFSVGHVPSKRR